MGLNGLVPAGVVTGDNLIKLMDYCKKNGHALPGKSRPLKNNFPHHSFPAFNCTSTSTINAVLQAARDINSPVIIQVKHLILKHLNVYKSLDKGFLFSGSIGTFWLLSLISVVKVSIIRVWLELSCTDQNFSVFKRWSCLPCGQGY